MSILLGKNPGSAAPVEEVAKQREVMNVYKSPPPHTYENTVRDPQAQSRVISRDLGLF